MAAEEKEILKVFGGNLKKIREEKGLSLRQLSYNCKVDFSKIAQMEKGLINPTLVTVAELAAALEVEVAVLFKV